MAAYNPAAPAPVARLQAARTPGRTRSDDVLSALRLAIVRGEIKPGERLTEESVALRFNVSRTPVRECFRRLEQEGLIQHLSYGGCSVRPIDLRETSELYEVRVALEEVSVERASRTAARETLEHLEAVWSQPEATGLDVVFADEEFHETIALAGGNGTLHTMLRGINQRLHILRVKDFTAKPRIEATFREHLSIVQAVLRGDTRLATALVRAHILESQAFVEQAARELEGAGA